VVDFVQVSRVTDIYLTELFAETVIPRLHDTTGCRTRCQTGFQTGLTTGCIVCTDIQPVVKPV